MPTTKKNTIAKEKAVVFSFGRINPPTLGHERLIIKVIETAKAINADHVVFLSQIQKIGTDPLSWAFKTQACKAAFPGVKFSTEKAVKTPFMALEKLAAKYTKIVFVVGGDRVDEFTERMSPYATQWGIKDFSVISAGQRNSTSRTVNGMSGSKMRNYVLEGKKEKFLKGLPNRLNSSMKEKVYLQTEKGMKSVK